MIGADGPGGAGSAPAPPARARSPIFDVQHLQLFSPLRALLERAGLADVELRPVHNR